MITYTQMLQYVTVVRNNSITKAAEELFIAQPAISANIKKIETELNTELFVYENKHLQLTADGERAYKIFAEILALYDKLNAFSQEATSHTDIRTGISYYASPSIHDFVTPQLQLFNIFPQLDFSIYNCANLESFFDSAQDENYVFGVFFIPATGSIDISAYPDYIFETITTVCTMLLISSKNNTAIAKKRSITLEEIRNLPLIRCLGSDLSIQNYLYGTDFNFVINISDSKQVSSILNERPYLYTLGTNIFSNNPGRNTLLSRLKMLLLSILFLFIKTRPVTRKFIPVYPLCFILYMMSNSKNAERLYRK